MAKLAVSLHGMRERIGYAKMTDFMLMMPEFITLTDGEKSKMVTLTAVPAWDAPGAAVSGTAAPAAVPDTPPAPPAAIDGQVFLPEKMLRILNKLIANDDTVPAGPAALAVLKQSYADAAAGGKLTTGADHYLLSTGLTAQNGEPIVASSKPSDREMPGWLNYLGTDGSGSPGKQLERFAYLGDRADLLQELAGLALDEKWDLGDGSRSILYNYLRFTFYRLKEEGKLAVSADGGLAAFNTGLVNTRYEESMRASSRTIPAARRNGGSRSSAWRGCAASASGWSASSARCRSRRSIFPGWRICCSIQTRRSI